MEKNLLKNINTLKDLAEKQDDERREEINKLKVKAEKTKSDKIREKCINEIETLELLKDKIVFKNHEDMCNKLGFVYKNNTESKLSNLKTLQQIAEYHKEGQKIIIDIILEEPRERDDDRKNNKRPYSYQDKIGEGVINLYIMQNESNGEFMFEDGRMYTTYKTLNENILGLTEEKKQAYFTVMKEVYGNKLTDEQFNFCNNEVIRFIETDLYNGFWSKMILGSYLKKQGFDNSTGLRAVIKRKGTRKDGSDFYYRTILIIPDSRLENEFSSFKKEFAENHKITPPWHKHTTDYNMLYASKEEWNECLREFLAIPNEGLLKFVKNCNDDKEVVNTVKEWQTNKDYILSFRDITERVLCKDDEIENLSKVFIVESPEKTINDLKSTHIFTRDDQIDLKVAVLDRISETFATRLQKKKTDRYYTVEASGLGEFTFKSKKLPKIMRTYESELMFCLVNSIETVEDFQKRYKKSEKIE